MSIAVASSPQRREHYLNLQKGHVEHPVTLIYDVKTRWNSTLNMLERALRMKDFTREWIREYECYMPLWSTPGEWKQVEYILEVLEPIRLCTLWMSRTRAPTIHKVFVVYDCIFDHLDNQISILENKRMRWKVDIREALGKARQKANKYYSKTENPRGLLLALGACLNPYSKLDLFKEWDTTEVEGTPSPNGDLYTNRYRQLFVQYYNENYGPPLETRAIDDPTPSATPARLSGFNRRNRVPGVRYSRPVERNESLEYIDSPNETDYNLDTENPLYESNVAEFWKNNSGRFPNLSRMARDILAVQGGSVGVERTFSMGRDVIPYRRNRLERKSIQATMIAKSYLREELNKDITGSDPEGEKICLRDLSALVDYKSSISAESSGGYISDDNEEGRRDISWEFVEHDGEKAFRRDRGILLPVRQEHSSKGKGRLQLVDGEDIDPGHETDQSSFEVESEGDVQDETRGHAEYSDEVHDTGNGHAEVMPEDQEETDLDESPLNEPISQNAEKLQGSRKRAASTLSGGRKLRKRK